MRDGQSPRAGTESENEGPVGPVPESPPGRSVRPCRASCRSAVLTAQPHSDCAGAPGREVMQSARSPQLGGHSLDLSPGHWRVPGPAPPRGPKGSRGSDPPSQGGSLPPPRAKAALPLAPAARGELGAGRDNSGRASAALPVNRRGEVSTASSTLTSALLGPLLCLHGRVISRGYLVIFGQGRGRTWEGPQEHSAPSRDSRGEFQGTALL